MICLKSERVLGCERNVLYKLIVLLMIIKITSPGQMWNIQWSPSTTFHWSKDTNFYKADICHAWRHLIATTNPFSKTVERV